METVNYHTYYSTPHAVPSGSYKKSFRLKVAKLLGVVGFVLLVTAYIPSIWFTVKSAGTDTVSRLLYNTATQNKVQTEVTKSAVEEYQPSFDSSLPTESRLSIPSVGVDTQIREASLENYENALRDGVWRVTDFGTPASRQNPTILVAHRFGYLKWSNLYRRKNSFYNLPKLKEGDTIEIVWRQRKYTYAIYKSEEGAEITDYNADLILYTCKELTGEVKYFQYAKLLHI